ncbi:hypothetical protein ACF0H5_022210 [Mactra antiquata]
MKSESNKQTDNNNNDKKPLDVSNNSSNSPKMSASRSKSSNSTGNQFSGVTRGKSSSKSHVSPSSSSDSDDAKTITNESKTFTCSVINCSAYFSSDAALKDHINNFKHSPCNPVALNKNCVLAKRPLCYMCPACDREFTLKEDCKNHMVEENHLAFYPPLIVTAYMCAQCLNIFGSFEDCWTHIEKMSHQAVTYAFADDQTSTDSGPVAVVHELVDNFIKECGKVKYSLECLECALVIESSQALHEHLEETNNTHTIASFTESTVGDVFATYLATYSCNVCHRLFSGELKELAKHQCSKKTIGTIIDSDTGSFSEFVKRCALTLIKSLDSDEKSMPGPSLRKKKSRLNDTSGDNNGNIPDIATGINKNDARPKILRKETTFEKRKNATKKKGSSATATQSYTEGAVCKSEEVDDHLEVTVAKLESQCSIGSKDKTTESKKKSVVINLDDSDTSDDTELCVSGASKRKRKQHVSDRTKQQVLDTSDCMVTKTELTAGIVIHDESDEEKGAVGGASGNTSRRNKSNQNQTRVENIKKAEGGNISIIEIQSDEETIDKPKIKPQSTGPDLTVDSLLNDLAVAGPSCASQSTQQGSNMPGILPMPPNYVPHPGYMPMSNPFSAFNFIPRSPVLTSNILTQGYIHQPDVKPRSAMSNLSSMPSSQSAAFPNVGPVPPPRYSLRNYAPQNIPKPMKVQAVDQKQQSAYYNKVHYTNRSKSPDLISTDNLKRMTNIIFLDLDNWPGFFTKLPRSLPDLTFIWGFFGGKNAWHEPGKCLVFRTMKQNGFFYLNDQCGRTKDAADFAIVLAVGKMDERLPSNIAFTILSGDKGFMEVERQMKESTRKVLVVNPHTAAQFSNDMIYALLTSITDT